MSKEQKTLTAPEKRIRKAKSLIKKSSLSFSEIGKAIDVSAGAVDHWSAGRNGPSPKNLAKLESFVKNELASARSIVVESKDSKILTIPEMIKAIQKSGLTYRQIGDKVGTSGNNVSKWARGARAPRKKAARRVARLFGKSIYHTPTTPDAEAPKAEVTKTQTPKASVKSPAKKSPVKTDTSSEIYSRIQEFRAQSLEKSERAFKMEEEALALSLKADELESVFDLLGAAGISGFERK